MEVPEQKLPRVEPGHFGPSQTLPRIEGQGVQDNVPHSDYPKWVTCLVRGPIMVQSAEEEAGILSAPEPAESLEAIEEKAPSDLITHTVTQDEIDATPELATAGLVAGDEIGYHPEDVVEPEESPAAAAE